MPQLQSVVLTDRTSPTPVDKTFVPREIDANGVGITVYSNGVPKAAETFSVSMRLSGTKYRGKLVLFRPVVQTITDSNGKTQYAEVRRAFATVDFVFDETSTEQERTDTVGMLASALATSKTLIHDTIVKLQGVY